MPVNGNNVSTTNLIQERKPNQPVQLNYGNISTNNQPCSIKPQNATIPTSGVNIQIFNPAVCAPGAQGPNYNMNTPCYPSNYYTGTVQPDGSFNNGLQNGGLDHSSQQGGVSGADTTSKSQNNITNSEMSKTSNNEKKTEKRKIVLLTDDYIKNLENHLNSPDKEVRLEAAKDVYARLEEDDSRSNDKALTALINKMLQDPCEAVRVLAFNAIINKLVSGDDYTVNVLKQIQSSPQVNRQDAVDASNSLLKMSEKQVEKEFEVKDTDKNKTKVENKK